MRLFTKCTHHDVGMFEDLHCILTAQVYCQLDLLVELNEDTHSLSLGGGKRERGRRKGGEEREGEREGEREREREGERERERERERE